MCYVETKNLDGETNLKHKMLHKDLYTCGKTDEEILAIHGFEVVCEKPSDKIYTFEGVIIAKN